MSEEEDPAIIWKTLEDEGVQKTAGKFKWKYVENDIIKDLENLTL
jgi:hypothetical protein